MNGSVATRCLRVAEDRERAIAEAVSVLGEGGVVAFPTETVYGLGVQSGDPYAVERLRRIKGREETKPFQILIGDIAQVAQIGANACPLAERLMARFWPGPLTLVLPAAAGGWLGLRLPDHAFVRDLVRAAGGPLVASSANRAREEPARDAQTVFRVFAHRVELVLDGGPVRIGRASTVVRVAAGALTVLREDAVSAAAIYQEIESTSDG